jgi:formate dehydrogenase major subunit
MVKVTINGRDFNVPQGTTILQACEQQGIHIPTFCYDPRLKPAGTCRICVVEIQGDDKLKASCAVAVTDGMVVQTYSPKVLAERKNILEGILANHNTDCLTCEATGSCKLQEYASEYGVDAAKFNVGKKDIVIDNKFFYMDQSKCIKCGLCVKVVEKLQVCNAIKVKGKSVVAPDFAGFEYDADNCVSCGNCVSVCPVGALMPKKDKPGNLNNVTKTRSTCPFCGVGCQLEYHVKDNKIVNVQPVMDATNSGMLCVKGKFAYHYPSHPDRLTTPLIRTNAKTDAPQWREASWDEAYDLVAKKFKEAIDKYTVTADCGDRQVYKGQTENIGMLSSAKISNEDNYLAQKFARVIFKNNNVDICARL